MSINKSKFYRRRSTSYREVQLTQKQKLEVAKIVFNPKRWDVTPASSTEAIRCVSEGIHYTKPSEPLISLLVDSINNEHRVNKETHLSWIVMYLEHCAQMIQATKAELLKQADWFLPADIDEWLPSSPDEAVEDGIVLREDLHERCTSVYSYDNKGTNRHECIQRLYNDTFWTSDEQNAITGSFDDCVDFLSFRLIW